MKSQLKKIKTPKIKKGGSSSVAIGEKQKESDIALSFKLFCGNSIRVNDFNNYYENQGAAHKTVSDLMHIFNSILKETTKSVFAKDKKRQLHLNQMDDNKSIEIIEEVLSKGYGFHKQTIAEFDREYFEIIANGDGGRLIFVMSENLVIPLFIDPNHLIYSKASKNTKKKKGYDYPGFFNFTQEHTNYYSRLEEKSVLREAVIKYARKGEYKTVEEFLEAWDDANN